MTMKRSPLSERLEQQRARALAVFRRDFGAERRAREARTAPAPAATMSPVPDGTIAEVLAWVDEDPEARAQAAHDAEEERDTPRVTLLAELVDRGAESEIGGGAE